MESAIEFGRISDVRPSALKKQKIEGEGKGVGEGIVVEERREGIEEEEGIEEDGEGIEWEEGGEGDEESKIHPSLLIYPYENPEGLKSVEEACREYQKQVRESEGFDFEMPAKQSLRNLCRYRNVILDSSFQYGISNRLVMEELVREALKSYNENKENKVVFKEIIRANDSPSSAFTYYITFLAEETGNPVLKNYQVKAMKLGDIESEIMFCRPKPQKKKKDGPATN